MIKRSLATLALTLAFFNTAALAQDSTLVTSKSLSPDIAHALVKHTLDACRKDGFQVAVAIVDRGGNLQALVRDQYAGPFTSKVAELKAATSLNFKANTQALIEQTKAGMPSAGLRHAPGILIVGGGVMIQAGGVLVGAIGVSGAPGSDLDETCALKGLENIQDDLDFL